MSEIDQRTTFDKLFGGEGFAYPLGEDGGPDYGSVSVGKQNFKVVGVNIFEIDGTLVESLELENGQILPGRKIGVGS